MLPGKLQRPAARQPRAKGHGPPSDAERLHPEPSDDGVKVILEVPRRNSRNALTDGAPFLRHTTYAERVSVMAVVRSQLQAALKPTFLTIS